MPTARYAIESGKPDMVAMTRAHIAEPHIIRKMIAGQESRIRPCVVMGYRIDSIYGGQAVCIHNAATGARRKPAARGCPCTPAQEGCGGEGRSGRA